MSVAQQRAGREVLGDDPQGVAPNVVAREVRQAAPDRRASHVVDDRRGHVTAAEPGELRAQVPVDVLVEGEEVLVELADLLQDAAPVERGAAARPEDRLRRVVLALVALAVAPASTGRRPREDVAGAVQQLAPLEVPQLRRRPARSRMLAQRRDQLAQAVGLEFQVVVEQPEQLPAPGARAHVEGGGHADVLGQRDDPGLGPVLAQPLRRVVARPVVHDHDLEVAEALARERGQDHLQQVPSVVGEHGYGEQRNLAGDATR